MRLVEGTPITRHDHSCIFYVVGEVIDLLSFKCRSRTASPLFDCGWRVSVSNDKARRRQSCLQMFVLVAYWIEEEHVCFYTVILVAHEGFRMAGRRVSECWLGQGMYVAGALDACAVNKIQKMRYLRP